MNQMTGNKIHASDVNQMIILLQIFQNCTLCIRKFTGTRKSLNIMLTDQRN